MALLPSDGTKSVISIKVLTDFDTYASVFPRMGILAKMCQLKKSRALVQLNLKKANHLVNCYIPIVSLAP